MYKVMVCVIIMINGTIYNGNYYNSNNIDYNNNANYMFAVTMVVQRIMIINMVKIKMTVLIL